MKLSRLISAGVGSRSGPSGAPPPALRLFETVDAVGGLPLAATRPEGERAFRRDGAVSWDRLGGAWRDLSLLGTLYSASNDLGYLIALASRTGVLMGLSAAPIVATSAFGPSNMLTVAGSVVAADEMAVMEIALTRTATAGVRAWNLVVDGAEIAPVSYSVVTYNPSNVSPSTSATRCVLGFVAAASQRFRARVWIGRSVGGIRRYWGHYVNVDGATHQGSFYGAFTKGAILSMGVATDGGGAEIVDGSTVEFSLVFK